MAKNRFYLSLSVILLALVAGGAFLIGPKASEARQASAGTSNVSATYRGTVPAVHFDTSPPLRSIKPILDQGNTKNENEDLDIIKHGRGLVERDPVVQSIVGALTIPTPIVSFNGPPNLCGGCAPPDPNGEAGTNHVVVMDNVHFQIFTKTGTSVFGPAAINTLFAGFGGPCQTRNDGDPVVIFDQLADRWMLAQFTTAAPFLNCIALSTTADPTGSYYRWAFPVGGGNNFGDYEKFSMMPNAYFISTREFLGSSGPFQGVGAYAGNRAQMLAGNPNPTVISFLAPPNPMYNVGDGLLPADLDGNTLPPAGNPEYFMGSMDNNGGYGAPQDALTLWKFVADFVTPANSSFTLANTIPTQPFNSVMASCGGGRGCIPQPGTTNRIDHLGYRQRPTFRLAYRNMGTYENLLTNQSVSAGTGPSGEVAGVRWWEVRSPNASPVIYQEGTYAPGLTDGINRWMGSIAMNAAGSIGLAYSASSSTVFPSVYYTGRLQSDPLGQMPQGEAAIVNGTGSQTGGGSRWGDYTDTTVDPVDDCTFWHVNEWVPTTSAAGWQLRIGAFQFGACSQGTPTATVTGTPPTATRTSTSVATATRTSTPSPVPTACGQVTASNPAPITINDAGPASPYPSNITVAGAGTVASIRVSVTGLTHTWPDDIDMLLVGPNGGKVLLMSDAGGSNDVASVNLTFQDGSPAIPDSAQIASGTYGPADYEAGDVFPAPAPGGPYGTSLNTAFLGSNANGTWSLYIVDDAAADLGSISGGW
ncbi:MAG TPA: proprotein convertase P-domain-containing protein, partial [Chloroflexia bacterium]|nr:proprotein convertase P-domain-containing protein [Chloroflexia bacterium]